MLLSEAATAYLEQRRIEGYSRHTLASYRYLLGKVTVIVGDKLAGEITLQDLRLYLSTVADRKPATTAMRIRLLRVFCRWLYEEGYAPNNAALKLREPRLPQRVPKALGTEDLEMIRDACKTTREHALVEFLFATGCRAGEVSGIRRQDLDWDRRCLIVLGKGAKEREVYFGAKAGIWLRRYLTSRHDNSPYLFTTERGQARQLTPHQIWYLVKRIAARAGLRERVWPHVFRHTLGTTLLNQGAPLAAVQSILGHESPETTQIYAQLSGAARQQAYERYFIQ